jgi:hypothetical protein
MSAKKNFIIRDFLPQTGSDQRKLVKMTIEKGMKLRLIRRIYRQHLLWEKNMSKHISLLEVLVLCTIVVCIVIKYAPTLEKGRYPANCGGSYSCKNYNPKFHGLGDFPDRQPWLKNSYPGDGSIPKEE